MRAHTFIRSLCAAVLSLSTTSARDERRQQPSLRRERKMTHPRLETREEQPGVFSVSLKPPSDFYDADTRVRRRAQPVIELEAEPALKLEEMQSCRLYLEDMHYNVYNPQDSAEKWICIFENYVAEDSAIPYPYAVELVMDTDRLKDSFEDAGVESGQSYLRWESPAMITIDMEGNMLTLNDELSMVPGSGVWLDINEPIEIIRRRKLKTTGVMKTIVIRIVGDNIGPKSSLHKLQQEVFGSGLSLKSQMERCSHGQLVIEPFSGFGKGHFNQEIRGGVIEIRLTVNPTGKPDKVIENHANQAASYVLGNLASQFDLVLFVIPPGISPPFAAYAYVNTPYSYYLNDSIENLMIQMHEVGHNLGLQHAGEGKPGSMEAEYGDSTGYMGYTSTEDPSMCYNAANNYQLGWYSQYTIHPTSQTEFSGTFVVSGVAGYNPNASSKFVTLRIEQPRLTADYYIGFNWAYGINTDTQEDRDQLIITEKNGDVHESTLSWKKAALNVGESFVIQNYDGSGRKVTVTFVEITLNDAIVDIELEPLPSSSPSSSPSSTSSMSPSLSPSSTPSSTPSSIITLTSSWGSSWGSSDIKAHCDYENLFKVNVRTDENPWENKWKFKSKRGEWIEIKEFDSPNTDYEYEYCMEYDTCYVFMFFDELRDGMGASPDGGYYEAYIGGERQFGKQGSGDWNRKEVYRFCTLPQPSLGSNETSLEFESDIDWDFLNGNETDHADEIDVIMDGNQTLW